MKLCWNPAVEDQPIACLMAAISVVKFPPTNSGVKSVKFR